MSKDLVTLYPELPAFLDQLGIKKLYLEETLRKVNLAKLSNTGAGQIGAKIINQYRYDLSKENVGQIKKLKIFPVRDKLVTAMEVKSIDEVNKDFADYVFNHVDKHDIKPFFSKLDISIESKINSDVVRKEETVKDIEYVEQQGINVLKSQSFFKSTPNLQKWRSAEKNAHEYLKSLECVLSVADVSNANMGYDLEVLLNNGKKLLIEIKSVSSFSEPIKITNNEYSSAHS